MAHQAGASSGESVELTSSTLNTIPYKSRCAAMTSLTLMHLLGLLAANSVGPLGCPAYEVHVDMI